MNYKNETGKDIQLPIPHVNSKNGIIRPVSYLTIKNGESKEVPKEAEIYAQGMGLIVKAVESSIGNKGVETKKIQSEKSKILKGGICFKVYTQKELYAMKKAEQTKILKGYDCEVPKYEKDRVELILIQQEL